MLNISTNTQIPAVIMVQRVIRNTCLEMSGFDFLLVILPAAPFQFQFNPSS